MSRRKKSHRYSMMSRIETTPMGSVQVCGSANVLVGPPSINVFRSYADKGQLGPGWTSVPDGAASDGYAAKSPTGKYGTFRSDLFGAGFDPPKGTYDVWFRVRVTTASGTNPEMILGAWDDTDRVWLASTTYSPNQIAASYEWFRVAAGMNPTPGHSLRFLAAATMNVSTDWYIDEAAVVPMGSPPPAS